jgi:hypothetical protein
MPRLAQGLASSVFTNIERPADGPAGMPDGGSGHADTIDSAACPLAARAQQADRMRGSP